MKISTARLDVLIWVLIYGGLLAGSLGVALQRGGESYGWGLLAGSAVAVLLGVALVWVRSRTDEPAP